MNNYRYTLETYKGMKTRHRCPGCDEPGKFTHYIDQQTGEALGEKVGKCERTIKCGYHYPPKQHFNDNNISFESLKTAKVQLRIKPKLKPKTNYINYSNFQLSQNSKQPNYFIDYLASIWDYKIAYYLADKYNIGTSKYWSGATVFWQMDSLERIRSGKVMLYNPVSGKRIKKPYNHINWVHKILKLETFILEQCYFGEHLLKNEKEKPVAIVESEKTAVIASVFLPEFIWLACGSVNNLSEAKTKILEGRNVVLFPDLGCMQLWKSKIPQLTKLATFRTSTLLERKANENEKKQGLDIADYLIGMS